MEIWEKYIDLWEKKEQSRPPISGNKPIIFFMDGQKVTRTHPEWMPEMPERMATAAAKIIDHWKIDCIIYAFLDEISVILTNPRQVMKQFQLDRVASHLRELFLQRLLPELQALYPGMIFWIDVYEIDSKDVSRYLTYRKEFCQSGAVFYYAKKYLPKAEYSNRPLSEVEQLLKELLLPGTNRSCYDDLCHHSVLANGIYIEKTFADPDLFETMIERQETL